MAFNHQTRRAFAMPSFALDLRTLLYVHVSELAGQGIEWVTFTSTHIEQERTWSLKVHYPHTRLPYPSSSTLTHHPTATIQAKTQPPSHPATQQATNSPPTAPPYQLTRLTHPLALRSRKRNKDSPLMQIRASN